MSGCYLKPQILLIEKESNILVHPSAQPARLRIVFRCHYQAHPIMHHIWKRTAEAWGPQAKRQSWLLHSSAAAQRATRDLYYKLHEEEELGGWGSACKSALGKMEYHLPSCAALTSLAEWALAPAMNTELMSDCAIKCGIRHFDTRIFHGCAIIDCEVRRQVQAHGKRIIGAAPLALMSVVLMKCSKDPIQLSEMSKRVAGLQGMELRLCQTHPGASPRPTYYSGLRLKSVHSLCARFTSIDGGLIHS